MTHSRCSRRTTRAVVALAAALLVGATASAPAGGATTRSGDEVVVEPHEVIHDDLIVWGGYVRVDGIVQGDLIAFGGDVVVEGVVEGDLVAGGRTVYLNGVVGDDVRVGAYAIALGDDARIGDDCFTLAYSLESKPASRIGGTLFVAARQALLAGSIAESVAARTGALELRGLVGGDVAAVVGGLEGFTHSSFVVDLAIDVPDVAPGLRLASGAHVGADLDYRAERAADVARDARVAGQIRAEPWGSGAPAPDAPAADEEGPSRWRDALERFALLALVGAVLVAAAPRWLDARAERMRTETVTAVGWGLGALIATGLASLAIGLVWMTAFAAFVQVSGGLALAVTGATFLLECGLFAGFLFAAIFVAPALACVAIGTALLGRIGRAPARPSLRAGFGALVVGGALYCALRAVPVLGVLVAVAASLAGMGALASWLEEARRDASVPR